MLATSLSADDEFAPCAKTYRKNSRWPVTAGRAIATLRTEVRPSRSFALADVPAAPPVTHALAPDGTVPSCLAPLDEVPSGFARLNLPLVEVSVPSGFAVQPRPTSRSSSKAPQRAIRTASLTTASGHAAR